MQLDFDLRKLDDLEALYQQLDMTMHTAACDEYDKAGLLAAQYLVEERIKTLREAIAVTQGLGHFRT